MTHPDRVIQVGVAILCISLAAVTVAILHLLM